MIKAHLSWSSDRKAEILQDYSNGMPVTMMIAKHNTSYRVLKAFLEAEGVYDPKGHARAIRKSRLEHPHILTPAVPGTFLPDLGYDGRLNFAPMLQVDIKTGKVLVDRRDEVLPRKQRGGMYGGW